MRKLIILLVLAIVVKNSYSQNTANYSPVSDEFLSTILMTAEEKNEKTVWVKNSLENQLPFSFVYNGKQSSELLKQWNRKEEAIETNLKYSVKRISFTDKETGLVCYADVKEFNDYPAVEWTVYFKNTGKSETPIIENINAINSDIPNTNFIANKGIKEKYEIYYSKGSQAQIDDFISKKDILNNNSTIDYISNDGRSSNDFLPFFNLKQGNGGLIIALGWTGTWKCSFASKHENDTVNITAGMNKTHLKLLSGEEIRTPKILVFFWKGEIDRSYNMFRRFMLNYHTPKQKGKPITMPISSCTWGGMKEKSHLDLIKVIKEQKLEYDCYWIDAGWYGPKHETEEYQHMITNDWARHVGNWNYNPAVVPNGFKKVSNAAHDAGMKLLLWFEPERAINGTPWTLEHPDYFIKKSEGNNYNMMYNLGNPEALKFLTGFLSDFMTKNSIDIYRQDCNFSLAEYWHFNDKEDRIGITEIKYITGLYKFWDDLRLKVPGMFIDNCASGGRRIDIESLDRSVPMSRSDYCCVPSINPTGAQIHNNGLMHWVPLSATINYTKPGYTYGFRSDMNAGIQFSLFDAHGTEIDGTNHVAENYPYEWHRKMMADFKRARPYFYGDYYPLNEISTSDKNWSGYQLDRPDLSEGMILCFKRQQSPYTSAVFILKGVDENSIYQFENADNSEITKIDGKTITAKGFLIKMENTSESQLWFYKKIK